MTIYIRLFIIGLLLSGCSKVQLCHKVLSDPSESIEFRSPNFSKIESENTFAVADKQWISKNEGIIPDLIENWLVRNTNVTVLTKTITITNMENVSAQFKVEFSVQLRTKGDVLVNRNTPDIEIESGSSHDFKLEIPVTTEQDVVDVGVKVNSKKIQIKNTIVGTVLLYKKQCFSCQCEPQKDRVRGQEIKYANQQQLDSLIYKFETE